MHINRISDQTPFTTKDGSTITSILDESNAPVKNQSLAEATLPAKGSTQRHYHKMSEEFYYLLTDPNEQNNLITSKSLTKEIRKLREKIGDSYFKTIKGVGYKFQN